MSDEYDDYNYGQDDYENFENSQYLSDTPVMSQNYPTESAAEPANSSQSLSSDIKASKPQSVSRSSSNANASSSSTLKRKISTQTSSSKSSKNASNTSAAINKTKARVSTDVNTVLAKVVALTLAQRRSALTSKSSSASDLGLEGFYEVKAMGEIELRSVIEKIVLETVNSIMRGDGFSFKVPSRTAKNQVFVKELDRILLKDSSSDRAFGNLSSVRKTTISTRVLQLIYELSLKRIHVTKRDLFYTDVKLFQQQAETDTVLDDVACMFGCTRTSLHVVAAEKGVVVGQLSFRDDGDLIDCTKMGVGGKAITGCYERISDISSTAKFILLIEKDAAFMRLAEDRFYNKYPCIIITAKGQPDVATRMFLKRLKTELQIPVLGLVDSDPYGLKILSVYMSGSKNMSYDSHSLTTPDIKWLGVRPSDLDKYNIPQQCRLPMTDADVKTGKELLEEDFIKQNPAWHKELELMVNRREKAEIQALSNFGFQYLTEVYLPLKLQEGDWI